MLFDENAFGDKVMFCPQKKKCLVLNLRKNCVMCFDMKNKYHEDTLELNIINIQATCMIISNNGDQFAVGFENGMIKIFTTGRFDEIDSFEPFQRLGIFQILDFV